MSRCVRDVHVLSRCKGAHECATLDVEWVRVCSNHDGVPVCAVTALLETGMHAL